MNRPELLEKIRKWINEENERLSWDDDTAHDLTDRANDLLEKALKELEKTEPTPYEKNRWQLQTECIIKQLAKRIEALEAAK